MGSSASSIPIGSARKVIVAPASGRWIAIDQDAVAVVATLQCTPPLPGAAPWVEGLGDHGGQVAMVITPFGSTGTSTAKHQVSAFVLSGTHNPVIAIRIDGAAQFDEATPIVLGERASLACPAAWLSPCRLAKGHDGVLLDTHAIRSGLEAA
jgi:hypothetical protein